MQENLFEELKTKLPNEKTPSLDDLTPQNLPYLNGCVMETLRLHPGVPEEMKVASRDVQFPDGTVVPKGVKLIFSPFSMGRYVSLSRSYAY